MKTSICVIVIIFNILNCSSSYSQEKEKYPKAFTRAKEFEAMMPVEVVRRIELPEGYREGLLLRDGEIWVNNGEGGDTWVVDRDSGTVVSKIKPVGTFTEGITAFIDETYWVTDWDDRRLYRVSIENGVMIPQTEVSLSPAFPAGVVWTGTHLYVITWTRGVGTKYHLLKMDQDGTILETVLIKKIPEPSQLTWDGTDLWITSWFDRRAYRIDAETYEITGYFRSGIERLTGIAWDGECFWVTGTKADLVRIGVIS